MAFIKNILIYKKWWFSSKKLLKWSLMGAQGGTIVVVYLIPCYIKKICFDSPPPHIFYLYASENIVVVALSSFLSAFSVTTTNVLRLSLPDMSAMCCILHTIMYPV